MKIWLIVLLGMIMLVGCATVTPPITNTVPSPAPTMPPTVPTLPTTAIATPQRTIAPSPSPRATPPSQIVGGANVQPILIESVEVAELQTAPVQYRVLVSGILSDPCTKFHSEEKSQIGNTIVITLTSTRQPEVMCIQVVQPFEHTIGLGTLAPGKYVVRVNGVEQTFTAR